MKISTRLSLTTSLIASVLLFVFAFTVYVFSSNYREQSFQERLKERVVVTEKIFLEKESFSQEELVKITDQFLHTLPNETEELVVLNSDSLIVFKYDYPEEVVSQFWIDDIVDFKDLKRQGECRKFHVKGKDYLIIVTAKDEVGYHYLRFLKNVILLLIMIGIPLIFFSSFSFSKHALKPLSNKIAEANGISANNLHQRLEVLNPEDEIGELAISFNKLLERLEEAFELQKSFISNASHEIKNPLTIIMGEAELAISLDRSKTEYVKSLKTILGESEILNGTVNNLLHLSRVSSSEEGISFDDIDINVLLKSTLESYSFQNSQANISFDEQLTSSCYVRGNRNLLQSVLINLLDNACKFSSNKEVKVLLSLTDGCLELQVVDTGVGIPQKEIVNIETPFYRGTNVIHIKGSGIGLALCSRIIKLHDGVLIINSVLNKGSEVIVKLPLR